MVTRSTPSSQELLAIQEKLDTWELEHLREHAAALHLRIEALEAEVERLQSEAYAADARADMFMALNSELQANPGARVAITRDGQVGVLQ
jgi:hypothetical protein